ncbi:MAG: glycoside hydrolase N-terminal domain-containing protein [Bacteroidaceae bacterium]|nr:glycoside hydrolase N-terminal domain-containing protein [Bacteroidaceae bacterium]
MKTKRLFLYMLTLIMSIANLWAVSPIMSDTSTGTPESGKKYYIYADTYYNSAYVPRYLYNNDGTLALSTAVDESSDNYVWTCTITNGKYTFQNVGNTAKYLGHKALADAAYNFTLGKAAANHAGTTIWSDNASRYLVTKNDGSTFDQAQNTYNQTSSDWCTDYVFVEYIEPTGNHLSVTANYAGAGEILVNGEATTLPYNEWENTVTLPVTLTATANNPYTFVGFFNGDENLGTEYTVSTLDENISIEARYSIDIFSSSLENPIPVAIYNNRDKAYSIKMNAASSYTGNAINSGSSIYGENEIWYLVGTPESFKMYSRTAGNTLAVTLAGTGSGSVATLTTTGTDLCIVSQADGAVAICPAGTNSQSFNMFGGAGQNIKLYSIGDGGSVWNIKKIDTDKVLKINYNAQTAGGYEQNYKIGELAITIDGATGTSMLEKTTIPASSTMYLPEGATFGISKGYMCHGWKMDFNGSESLDNQTLPEGGLIVNVNIAVDTDNKYQYLFYSPGPNGHPYRIPALTTTANGYVFAINDYRPCGNDIGYGEVDLVMRHSTAAGSEWDGHSWTESVTIADGLGNTNEGIWKLGFGDPAIVADRESNEVLVMSVCGNRTCWDGNYGSGTDENPENPNRVARLYIKFNESTKEWEVGEPEEVTYDLYPLFKDSEGTVHSSSMFIGAGRIAQSSKIKVGTHYRIYCAVWVVTMTNRQHHNYAIYSDDFGKTWNLLGELGYDNCPSKYGNEPKCEELPDGSVLLSSRKYSGRYFNVFRYTDAEKGEGSWVGEVSTNDIGDLAWGGNSTNGEPILVGNVLFQSAPTGNDRSNVAIFYKVLSNDPADYTPTKLSSGWTKIAISNAYSAYSSMTLLPDKETLAIYYEEAPGGYSMVYLPLKLKEILPADVYQALSALPPTFASESSPAWHQIKFSASGDVLCDQGAGNNVATATAEESDACLWNIVGNKEGFYLVSKLGNYLAYDATNNRYTTTADKSDKAALTLTENIKGSWEIMRKGSNKSMSQITATRAITGSVGDADILGDANQISFLSLATIATDPAIFSTEDSPAWYQVVFQNGNWALADKGAEQNALTASKDGSDNAQYWQFIGAPDSFYMKSKNGNWLGYSSETSFFYSTTEANKVELSVFKTANGNYDGAYEIQRIGAEGCMNMYQGAGSGKKISEWTTGDSGNPVAFILEGEEPEVTEIPFFSTEAEPTYWWAQFLTGSAVIADQGAGSNVQTAEKSYTDAQLWQLVGDETGFYMKNKSGNYLTWNSTGSRFATSASADDKATLILHENSNAGYYEIQLSGITGNSYMNQFGGTGTGKELGVWTAGDSNNPLTFISAEPTFPNFSDDSNSYWYFIKFGNGGWVIEDKGIGSNIQTATIDDLNSQKWKLVGTKNSCQIINKDGNYLTYDGSRVKTSATADAQGFKIVATANSSYPLYFEIQHASSTTTAFNMFGGAGAGKEIGLWDSNDSGNPLQFISESDIVYPEFKVAASSPDVPEEKLTLWYTQPAPATKVANTWMEYSLPLGNGQLGASLFGGVSKDEILFNEKTLWSGGPNSYGYYLPFGSVYIEDISGNFTYNSTKPVQNYYRDLNLATATGTVTYEDVNGVKYTKQYITSNPDKAIVTKITASEAGKLSFRITMESGKPTVSATTSYSNGYAQFTGKLQTVSYNATLKVVAKGGFTSTGADGIIVEEADEVLIVLVGSTDFIGNDASHVNGNAENLPADNKAQADAVAERGWDAVYAAHVADHQKFFNRVVLELDEVENNLPTNELIDAYNAASGKRNLMLEQLYYNYGRYLSIASSRGADLPNNLQGIWNNTCTPPWHSDIHANINVQMNYWPVSAGNLNEMYEPFLNYIINEAAQPEWRGVASNAVKSLNDSIGTNTAVREDSWTCLTENNIFGGISGFAPNYVIANAWYVTHLWQHYRYTLDKEFLAKAFPAMKGASLFWADRMVLAADGTYECPREFSPEHGPDEENAVAHAQQIAWEALDNTIKAADILGGVAAGIITEADYELIIDRFTKMDKGLATEVYDGSWGSTYNNVATGDSILREWKYSTFTASNDRSHRHMSHLMALFPFGQLTPASKYFEPAINSMKLRGDESTGWSMGWKINLWARALMGDRSHAILRKALKHSTSYGTNQYAGGIYYNLYDSHAPFQIDGNFGATSGINEMLLQSHTDVIDILPALPTEWSKGSISGLKAVGDFTVSIEWDSNQASKVTIINNQGQPCYVKCAGIDNADVTVNGTAVTLGEAITVNGLECYQIASSAGDNIVITFSNATQVDKSALETLIAKTEELIDQCYDYYANEATLTVTEGENYYIWSNADHNDYNSSKDGGGVPALIDGESGTFFHTNWNNAVTAINDDHFIEVNLGDENAVSEFKFYYQARTGSGLGDYPKTIKIQGSNNDSDYTDIATVEPRNENGGIIENGAEWTSGTIGNGNAYSTLRFYVTVTTTNKTAGGHIFWHMAEFGLTPRSEEPVINYPGEKVADAVEAAQAEVEVSANALTIEQTVAEYKATLADLQTAYDNLLAAIENSDDDVTGIVEIEDTLIDNALNGTIFDLTGRKLGTINAPGIYIINGKKVFVE